LTVGPNLANLSDRPGFAVSDPPAELSAVDNKRGETEALAMPPAREWFVTLRIQVARAGVGFALLLGLLGSVMTFVPGYQAEWFGVAAAGALTGYCPQPGGCASLP
jgi:hypothetical protein